MFRRDIVAASNSSKYVFSLSKPTSIPPSPKESSSSPLSPVSGKRSAEDPLAVYRMASKPNSPKLPRSPKAAGPSEALKPVIVASRKPMEKSLFVASSSDLLKPHRKIGASNADTGMILPSSPHQRLKTQHSKPIMVQKAWAMSASGSSTPGEFPAFRPITASSSVASMQGTPKARTPRQLLSPVSRSSEKLASLVTQVKPLNEGNADSAVPARSEDIYREHLFQTFLALKFVRLLPQVDARQLAAKRVTLPRRPGFEFKKTLVLDLDETLVHCVEGQQSRAADVILPIKFPTGEVVKVPFTQAGVNIRPYVHECLREANRNYEVIVFTASHQCYADTVLDYLDPTRDLIHHRLYRDNCVSVQGVYIKDLRVLIGRDLAQTVIVDNAAYSFAYQLDNGIPIISWREDRSDHELLNLIDYLQALNSAQDIRPVNAETFHLGTFYEDYAAEYMGSPKAGKMKLRRRKEY